MPKVMATRKKVRSSPLSLVQTLEKESKVTPKQRRRTKTPKDNDSDDENILQTPATTEGSQSAKIEQLTRDILEMDEEVPELQNEMPDGSEEMQQIDDDLRAYPLDQSILSSELMASSQNTAPSPQGGRTLGDLIFEKMQEKSRQEAEAEKLALFTAETIHLFKQVGTYMAKYRSGKLPKALRFIPNLRNWLDVLWLTSPEKWSPHAVAAATPMFVGNTTDNQARSYMTHVLLPAVLADLSKSANESTARLNVHLYEALCRCVRRPSLFFKAIYFPVVLAEDGGCNYRQAVVLSSVVARESFPGLEAAAAIIKLCQHEPQSNQIYYCILRLLNKKHDLPLPAVHIIAAYFLSAAQKKSSTAAESSTRRSEAASGKSRSGVDGVRKQKTASMPVIWHQALLVFIQRWSAVMTEDQKALFKKLFKIHYHPKITDECRRQLFDISACGGVPDTENMAD